MLLDPEENRLSPLQAHVQQILQNDESLADLSLSSRFHIQSSVNIVVKAIEEGNDLGVLELFTKILIQNQLRNELLLHQYRTNLGIENKDAFF